MRSTSVVSTPSYLKTSRWLPDTLIAYCPAMSPLSGCILCLGKFISAKQLSHPDDVVSDPHLSLIEKRALLAAWASDAHAVPDAPTLRQLDNGAVVSLTTISASSMVSKGIRRPVKEIADIQSGAIMKSSPSGANGRFASPT